MQLHSVLPVLLKFFPVFNECIMYEHRLLLSTTDPSPLSDKIYSKVMGISGIYREYYQNCFILAMCYLFNAHS